MGLFSSDASGLPGGRSRMPLVVGGVVAILALGGGGVALALSGGGEGGDAAAAAPSASAQAAGPAAAAPAPGALAVAGEGFACEADGAEIHCFGQNSMGQLGKLDQGAHENRFSLAGDVISMSAGADFACATDGTGVTCWGDNRWKQAGDVGATSLEPTPLAAFDGAAVLSVAAGENHACAIAEGQVTCWGADNAGQFGKGMAGSSVNGPAAVALPEGEVPVRLEASRYTTYVLCESGSWFAFGSNFEGRIDSSESPYLRATKIGSGAVAEAEAEGA